MYPSTQALSDQIVDLVIWTSISRLTILSSRVSTTPIEGQSVAWAATVGICQQRGKVCAALSVCDTEVRNGTVCELAGKCKCLIYSGSALSYQAGSQALHF